jgi:excisionase family DNA binding protein
MADESLMVDLRAAARMMGISMITAYRLAGQGKIPGAVKIGESWRVNRVVLEEFLKGQPAAESSEAGR